jgi:hypothetical protein
LVSVLANVISGLILVLFVCRPLVWYIIMSPVVLCIWEDDEFTLMPCDICDKIDTHVVDWFTSDCWYIRWLWTALAYNYSWSISTHTCMRRRTEYLVQTPMLLNVLRARLIPPKCPGQSDRKLAPHIILTSVKSRTMQYEMSTTVVFSCSFATYPV